MHLRHPVWRIYGVAMISRLLKITGLLCRIPSLLYWALLQKRRMILRSLLIVAPPYLIDNTPIFLYGMRKLGGHWDLPSSDTRAHTYTHTHTHTHTHTRTRTHIHTHAHTYTNTTHAHTYTHTPVERTLWSGSVCMCVCVCVYVCVCVCVRARMCVCMCAQRLIEPKGKSVSKTHKFLNTDTQILHWRHRCVFGHVNMCVYTLIDTKSTSSPSTQRYFSKDIDVSLSMYTCVCIHV